MLDYIPKENHFIAFFTINTVPKQLYREYCLTAPSEQAEGNKRDENISRKIQYKYKLLCTLHVQRNKKCLLIEYNNNLMTISFKKAEWKVECFIYI